MTTFVFDKAGMLTRGESEVVAVAAADHTSEDELLALVAGAEGDSEHPLGEAIVSAALGRALEVARATRLKRCRGTARWQLSLAAGWRSATRA